jgi:Tfp pilus assembly protein PilO
MEIIITIASIVSIIGILGMSHKNLSSKISNLEEKTTKFMSEEQIRRIVSDKDEILAVQLRMLVHDIQEIKEELKKLNRK